MEQLVASRVIGQHQRYFLAVLLLLAAWLGSRLQANAQQAYNHKEGYFCSDSGKKSCNAFALYRAQEKYSSVSQIAELFNTNAAVVAKLNKLSAKQTLDMEKVVIIPIICHCGANSTSFANISYTIVDGDFYYDLNAKNFEFLSTITEIEAANSKLNDRNLQPGQKIVIPLRCACPSKAQISKGVKSLVTYPVALGDTVDPIASSFGVSSADVMNANTLMKVNPRIIPETTLVIPSYSSHPSYPYEAPSPVGDPESPLPPGGAISDQSNGGSGGRSKTGIIIVVCVVILTILGLAYYIQVLRPNRQRDNRTEEEPLNREEHLNQAAPCPARRTGDRICSSPSSSSRSISNGSNI